MVVCALEQESGGNDGGDERQTCVGQFVSCLFDERDLLVAEGASVDVLGEGLSAVGAHLEVLFGVLLCLCIHVLLVLVHLLLSLQIYAKIRNIPTNFLSFSSFGHDIRPRAGRRGEHPIMCGPTRLSVKNDLKICRVSCIFDN